MRCISEVGDHLANVGLSETVVLSPSCSLGPLKSLLEILMPGPHSQRLRFYWSRGQPGHQDFFKDPRAAGAENL